MMFLKGKTFKVIVAVLFVGVIYLNTNIDDVITIIWQVQVFEIVVAILIVLLIRLLMAARWKLILDEHEMPIPFFESVYIILVSGSVGFFSPGGVAADFLKGHHAYKKDKNLSTIASVVLFDKLVGVFSMLFLVSLCSTVLLFMPYQGDYGTLKLVSYVSSFIVMGIFFCVAILISFEAQVNKQLAKCPQKIRKIFIMIYKVFKSTALNKSLMIKVLSLSFAMQLLRSLMFYFILTSLSIEIAVMSVIAYFPIVFMLMLLPITVGGVGVRESATFVLFSQFDVNLEYSIGSGLIFYGIQLLVAVLGIFTYLGFSTKVSDRND